MKNETEKSVRPKPWRKLPCPGCGQIGFIKDFVNGYPGGEIDQGKHIYGGCLPEYWSRAEIACTNCEWEGSKEALRNAKPGPVKITSAFEEALNYAKFHHSGQFRKGTMIPYISHAIGVASLILEAGGDEELAIAGLLHDVPEDCGGEARLIEIREKFGPRIESIVRSCSDALPSEGEAKAPWKARKTEHIHELASASDDALLVTAADKTHNARAIATDLGVSGPMVWNRFNASRDDILWYYREVFYLLASRNVSTKVLVPLESAISAMDTIETRVHPWGIGMSL